MKCPPKFFLSKLLGSLQFCLSFFRLPFAGGVAPVAARQTYLRSVNVQCCSQH